VIREESRPGRRRSLRRRNTVVLLERMSRKAVTVTRLLVDLTLKAERHQFLITEILFQMIDWTRTERIVREWKTTGKLDHCHRCPLRTPAAIIATNRQTATGAYRK